MSFPEDHRFFQPNSYSRYRRRAEEAKTPKSTLIIPLQNHEEEHKEQILKTMQQRTQQQFTEQKTERKVYS